MSDDIKYHPSLTSRSFEGCKPLTTSIITLGINDAGADVSDAEFVHVHLEGYKVVSLSSNATGQLLPYRDPPRNWAPIAFRLAWQQYWRHRQTEALATIVDRLSKAPGMRPWIGPWQHENSKP